MNLTAVGHPGVFKRLRSRHNSHLKQTASIFLMCVLAGLLSGCGKDPAQMSDAELGLNPAQARGRRVYNLYCLNCHPAYSSRGNKGPGLKKLYGKEYLPSGLTTTDEHVMQSIVRGRNMMPRFGDQLNQDELQDLMAYLHTL
jgi:mono/diheme cytochrome c family protein